VILGIRAWHLPHEKLGCRWRRGVYDAVLPPPAAGELDDWVAV